jgi:tetratricopeptide (TPR) repeat protein
MILIMKNKELLKKIPKTGFLKLTAEKVDLSEEDRIALIRKGNAYFNQGKYDIAKKIFLTAHYPDGLVRLGDYYLAEKKPLEAFRMFWLAKYPRQVDRMVEKMAAIIKKWIKEER